MNLIIFDGQLGAGKTLGMSLLAYNYYYKSDCTLYSNYGLKNSYHINSYKDFLHVAKQKHSIILWDEAHIFLDSRMSRNKGVIYLTQLSYYFRKMKTTVILTSPDINAIDKRLRQIANLYVFAEKRNNKFMYHFYDLQDQKKLKTFNIDIDKAITIGKNIYDTYTIVKPLELPKNEDDYLDFINHLEKVI